MLTELLMHGIINIIYEIQTEYFFLFRAGGGTSPTIPGNRFNFEHGANSCSQMAEK